MTDQALPKPAIAPVSAYCNPETGCKTTAAQSAQLHEHERRISGLEAEDAVLHSRITDELKTKRSDTREDRRVLIGLLIMATLQVFSIAVSIYALLHHR